MEMQPLRAGGELSEIIDRYQSQVYGLALAKTGSRSDAEDVFQEVFLAYFQSGKIFHDEEHRKAWLLRTTINLCRRVTQSSWRKKNRPSHRRRGHAHSLSGVGRKPGMAGPRPAGGDLPPAHLPFLLPGAVHPGDCPGAVHPPGCGAHAPVPWPGAAPGPAERRLF